jgi:vacuolar-type H+-ATPase subunit E/Vma4
MALEKLLTALEAEAAAEATQLEHDARDEARAIVEQARTEAQALTEQAARADAHDLERELAQRHAAARLAAAAALRQTREETFRTLLTAVRARLTTLRTSSGYAEMLRAAIEESLAALPAATALRVDPRDERLATAILEQLAARLPVVATLETAGGVEVVGSDGRSVHNTLEERFSNAEPALRLLFGQTLADDPPAPKTMTGSAA